MRIRLEDPLAGITTDCDLSTHLGKITVFPAATVAKTAPLTGKTVKEDLGSQVIDGLKATGTRVTQTSIPEPSGPFANRGQE